MVVKFDRKRPRPKKPVATHAQAKAIRDLVRSHVAQVEAIEPAAIRPVLKVLIEARRELREDLHRWLRTVDDPTEKFTAHKMRVMLRSLDGAADALGIRMQALVDGNRAPATALDRAMLAGLKKGSHATGALSVKMLEQEIVRLGHLFGQELVGPQLDTAIIIARGDKLLFNRYATSAARYAGNVGSDIRFQLSVGVARGETFEQLAQRLRRLGGPTGPVAVRGIFGNPNAIVEDIPEGLFRRYENWAKRLVNTEMMNAYNVQHREGIRVLNEGRAKGEPEYYRRCDETMDGRTCSFCREMDGKILRKNEGPPWHPFCRGIELAWREDWPEIGSLAEAA